VRRALAIGIDEYKTAPLSGCVNDAVRVGNLLARNEDGSPNFDTIVLTAPQSHISRAEFDKAVRQLLATEADVALFYFSGHGAINDLGGYLITQDAETVTEGFAMRDLLALATKSPIREVVIILDCCHSGAFGSFSGLDPDVAWLREGIAVLAASRDSELALEIGGGGVFTTLFCDALAGGGSDILGRVTLGSIYAHIDLALGAWSQRPMFKSHLSRFTPLRQCEPDVDAAVLRLLTAYFPTPDFELPLDPSFEPDAEPKDEKNERTFAHLQKLRDVRLLVPVDEKHLYFAAMNSKACKLTALGQYYWQLANEGRI
jgi:hypothetical protein